jgi:predicted esterase
MSYLLSWFLPTTTDTARHCDEMGLERSWFADANANERKASLAKTRGLLFELVNVLCLKYGWERSSIFLLGFSQGAAVALDVVCCAVC